MRVLLLLSLLSSLTAHGICPLIDEGETAEDCPWAEVARMMATKKEQQEGLWEVFRSELPKQVRILKRDSRAEGLKSLWGRSLNYDEFMKKEIVLPEILDLLFKQIQVFPREDRVVHAGVEHTYGYLFSNLKTSFGYKRARWVHGEIERGLNFEDQIFSPNPPSGTLFTNVTALLGKVSFEKAARERATLERERRFFSQVLHKWEPNPKRIQSLIERVSLDGERIELKTDLLAFETAQSNTHLLVYSITRNGISRIITGFPVNNQFVEGLFAPDNLGQGKPITTRYNAFVPGLTGKTILGERVRSTAP